ncbi:uncharacterized protein K02A2.6-like [Ornithodoros turicata]|uniref:uncharacterized protein K02A2.6-like n=1 Tax=Ornithodoros turicata TaxID=34597 RepID=UPI0031395DE0
MVTLSNSYAAAPNARSIVALRPELRHRCGKRPTEPWKTIHIDFAGPVDGRTYLLVVDAYTKWLEVRRMTSTTAAAVIEQLRYMFATFGIPQVVVSDNGSVFLSAETKRFFKANGTEEGSRSSAGPHRSSTRWSSSPFVDKELVCKSSTTLHIIALFFAAYWIFNIRYSGKAKGTLTFLERALLGFKETKPKARCLDLLNFFEFYSK